MREATYSTPQLAKLSGLTFRQVDYMTRRLVLEPENHEPGSGTGRRWTAREIAVASALAALNELGMGTDALRCVAEQLRAAWDQILRIDEYRPLGRWYVDRHGHLTRGPLSAAAWTIDLDAVMTRPPTPADLQRAARQ